MPIYGNTTGLPSSNPSIGRQYTGPNAIMAGLDTERSRAAFRQRIKARESKALELREYAYKYVYRWTLQEKISLINSYGEIDRLQNPNNQDEVNNQLVETLLINLSEAELNQIVANVNAQEQELKQQMQIFTKNAKARGQQASSVANQARGMRAQEFYDNIDRNQMLANPETGVAGIDPGREMEKQDPNFKRSMVNVKVAPGLSKELDKILKNMPPKEVIQIANKLKIKYTKETKIDTLKNEIKYVISVYLAAITGTESNVVGAVPVDDSAIKEVERIVGMTSVAWIVGKPILSPKALAAERKKALMRKKEFEMRKKMVTDKTSVQTDSKEFFKTAGISGSKRDLTKLLDDPKNDKGFLKDFSYEECMSKAYELGLDLDPQKTTLGELKVAIYAKIATQMKERKKLEKELAKSKQKDKKNKNGMKSTQTRELETLLSAHDKTIEKVKAKAIGMPDSMTSTTAGASGIPLITFEEGKIKTRNVTAAVPVVIVGEETALNLFNQGKTEIDALPDSLKDDPYSKTISENMTKIDKIFEDIDNRQSKISNKKSRKEAKEKEKLDKIKDKTIKDLDKPLEKRLDMIQKDVQKVDPKRGLFNIFHEPTEAEINLYNLYAKEAKEQIDLIKQGYGKTVALIKDAKSEDEIVNIYDQFLKSILDTKNGNKINFDGLGLTSELKSGEGTTDKLKSGEGRADLIVASPKVPDKTIVPMPDGIEDEAIKKIYGEETSTNKKTSATDDDNYNSLAKSWNSKVETKTKASKKGTIDSELDAEDQTSENWGDRKKGTGDHIYFNTAAKKMLKGKAIKREKITPVFLVNGFTEYLNTITEEGFDNLLGMTGSIYQYLSTTLPVLFQGLQQAGTAVNMATAGTAIATVLDVIQQVANAAMGAMDNLGADGEVYKYATGGTGTRNIKNQKTTVRPSKSKNTLNAVNSKAQGISPMASVSALSNIISPLTQVTDSLASIAGAAPTQSVNTVTNNSNYSQFITGDSKTGRVNPELVTVDWENQQFNVKPANESGNTVSNQTPLTSKERASAFKVSFSEATIRYQKTNDGETSDNIALKVYPVTPGITDKININGSSISLMDVMVGMYSSVLNLESLMSTNVEISKVIAANGSRVSGGSSSAPEMNSPMTFPDNLNPILRGE